MRLPAGQAPSQLNADMAMAEHHAEAERRGLPRKMPAVRVVPEGDETVYCLEYRAGRARVRGLH